MDLGADSLLDVLGDAELMLTSYGFDLERPPSAVQLAVKMTGHAPERVHMRVFEAYTLPLPSQRIFISHIVDDVRERFLTFHELAEVHHQRIGYRGDDVEARCNAMASAMCAPRPAMKRALRKYGHSVYDLALAMKTPQAATVLRIAEVTGRPCALERSACILVRGVPFAWPENENDWRALRKSRGRRDDVHPLRIRDEREERWAYMATWPRVDAA